MKKSGGILGIVNILTYVIMIIGTLLLLVVTLRYPQNHLISWQMVLGAFAGTVSLLAAGALWNKIYSVIGKRTALYLFALGCFGILLYITGLHRQGNEATLVDYTYVYRDAVNLANGNQPEYVNYFRTYSNNLKPMLLLSVLFRTARILGISEFRMVLLRNVILVLLVVWGCGFLAEKDGDVRLRFPILIAFMCLLPLWNMVSVFYTDSMSFGMGILVPAFLKKAQKTEIKWHRNLWAMLAACTLVLAIAWKITAIIPVIACGIVVILQQRSIRRSVVVRFGILTAVLWLFMYLWADTYEITADVRTTANPVISWVALGMKEDGSWTNNTELVERMYEFSTKGEKQAYCMEYIRENKSDFWNIDHLKKKASYNFANGNLGASAFLNVEHSDGTLIWEMFSPWGKYYWRTSQYCFCYLASMYILLLLGMILAFFNTVREKEVLTMLPVCQLSFFGIAVFLMFWEASARQLYNQMPGILLGSILSMDYFWKNLSLKARK